jgi:hypothetical protein
LLGFSACLGLSSRLRTLVQATSRSTVRAESAMDCLTAQRHWHSNHVTATRPSPPVSVSQYVFHFLIQQSLRSTLDSTLAHLCIKLFACMASPPALGHQTDREDQRGLHPGRLCGRRVLRSTRSTSHLLRFGSIPPRPQFLPRRHREFED